MFRNERYFEKNDGKHNFYGEVESFDDSENTEDSSDKKENPRKKPVYNREDDD